MAGMTEATIKKLKVNELKAELSKRGLAVKGKKDELVRRLLEALEGEDDVEEDVDAASGEEEEEEEEEEAMEDDGQDSAVGTSQEDVNGDQSDAKSDEETEEESKAPDSSCDVEGGEEAVNPDDYVVVTKPEDDVAEEVEKGAEAQDAVVEEQQVTEGTGEAMEQDAGADAEETPMEAETSSKGASPKKTPKKTAKKSPKKSPKKDDVTSSEVESKSSKDEEKESHRKSDGKEKVGDEAKNGEKDAKKDPEKKEEVKKEPEIPDVMSVVEDEEGEAPEEFEVPEGRVMLDPYINDFNFVISNNGAAGHTLIKNGFHYMWAGAKANKGAKGGKIGYELKVISLTVADLGSNEAPVNAVRIGWSSEYSNLMLGESSLSYGFESTGKVCASSSFFEYGESFAEGDVIGTYLDLESEPKTLRYTKNGEDLGVAMSLTVNLEEKPLFPHIYLRNMKVELNFGSNEEAWFETLEGYSLIQNADVENIADRIGKVPAEVSDCEVLMMVGLPSSGKTSWAKKHSDSHPKRHYNVIGLKQVMDRCKLEGRSRKKGDPSAEKLNKAAITILTKLYQLCPKRKRNFIYDQNNVYKISQEMKMTTFAGYKRKAVLVVPVHDSLRRRTSDSKRRGDSLVEIPFGDLCDMKCEFHLPEEGDLFDEIVYTELDEKNTTKTIRDYHSDGSRAKRMGRDDQYASKRKRYDDQRSSYDRSRDNRLSGSGGRNDGWKGSGSGSGSGYGGYDKGRSYQPSYGGSNAGGYKPNNNKPYNSDPYRRNSGGGGGGGGGYRQQSSYGGSNQGGGGGYRGNNNYSQSYGGSNSYGNQGGYGNQYNSNQNTQNQQWGQWGSYNSNSSNYRGGGGYSY